MHTSDWVSTRGSFATLLAAPLIGIAVVALGFRLVAHSMLLAVGAVVLGGVCFPFMLASGGMALWLSRYRYRLRWTLCVGFALGWTALGASFAALPSVYSNSNQKLYEVLWPVCLLGSGGLAGVLEFAGLGLSRGGWLEPPSSGWRWAWSGVVLLVLLALPVHRLAMASRYWAMLGTALPAGAVLAAGEDADRLRGGCGGAVFLLDARLVRGVLQWHPDRYSERRPADPHAFELDGIWHPTPVPPAWKGEGMPMGMDCIGMSDRLAGTLMEAADRPGAYYTEGIRSSLHMLILPKEGLLAVGYYH